MQHFLKLRCFCTSKKEITLRLWLLWYTEQSALCMRLSFPVMLVQQAWVWEVEDPHTSSCHCTTLHTLNQNTIPTIFGRRTCLDQDLFGFHTELFRTDCSCKRSQIQTKSTYAFFEQQEPAWLVVKDNFCKETAKYYYKMYY